MMSLHHTCMTGPPSVWVWPQGLVGGTSNVEPMAIIPLSCSSHIATATKLSAILNITALNVPANEHITTSYWTCEMQSSPLQS